MIILTNQHFWKVLLVWINLSIPNATNEWIVKACKALNGLKDTTNPDWEMRLYPGKDLTKPDPVALDELLLDHEVVQVIRTNHPDLLDDDKLFNDEATLCMFFSEERDAGLIQTLFEWKKDDNSMIVKTNNT